MLSSHLQYAWIFWKESKRLRSVFQLFYTSELYVEYPNSWQLLLSNEKKARALVSPPIVFDSSDLTVAEQFFFNFPRMFSTNHCRKYSKKDRSPFSRKSYDGPI